MSRENAYVKNNDSSVSKEERMTRLKLELREHVRFLSDYDIMSSDWLRMAESLNQIANVAFMETHLPPSESNPLQQQGKKSVGTLWDQEKDELAVRILLEEGKLNLALRILHKYMEFKRTPEFDKLIVSTCKTYNSPEESVRKRCNVFESGVGILLKYTLQHVEALQILDIPEFMKHVGSVLKDPFGAPQEEKDESGKGKEMQRSLVFHYLASLTLKMEEMDEDRIMDLMEKEKIFPLALKHAIANRDKLSLVVLKRFCVFLSHAMHSESFGTEPERFVKGEDEMKNIVKIKGLFVDELVEKHGLIKKEIQTLLDKTSKYEQDYGAAVKVPLGRDE